MTAQLSPDPVFQWVTTAGQPAVGYQLFTYAAGTSTPQATYVDSSQSVQNTNPVILNSAGYAIIWLNPLLSYKFVLQDAAGNQIFSVDNINGTLTLNQSLIPTLTNTYNLGSPLFTWANGYFGTAVYVAGMPVPTYPITPAETAAGFLSSTLVLNYPYGNMLRYGIVANSTAPAANNLAILIQLFNPLVAGPVGDFYFPNTTGTDIYTFGVVSGTSPTVPIRPNVHITGNYCTINVVGTSTAVDVNVGFFYTLSDFILENITINSTVNTTAGNNAASCVFLGARSAGNYFSVTENTQSPTLGRIVLRNVTMTVNNTGAQTLAAVGMLGGFSDVLLQNLTINCNSVALYGIYYEWGYWTTGTVPGTAVTTHAKNMTFESLRILNASTAAVGMTGSYNCIIDGLYSNGCATPFIYSVGQAMFYNVSPNDTAGAKRNMTLRNIVGQACTATMLLSGANSAISGIPSTPSGQTDLMSFDVDGVSIISSAGCMTLSGNTTVKNGFLNSSGTGLNPLTINDDCIYARFDNVKILNGTGAGVRADVAGTGAWSPIRQKFVEFDGCQVAGNVTAGFELNNVASCKITNCRIGYSTLYDPAGEATQVIGVLVDSGCNGVICDSNFVTTSSGNAYSITGLLSNGCNVINPLGTVTTSGSWDVNGVSQASLGTASTGTNVAGLANKNTYPNAANKYAGKMCVNNSNGHLYVAAGSATTANWVPVDTGDTAAPATITPA